MVTNAGIYIDESGTHANSEFIAIAGYIFLKGRARRFEEEWEKALRKYQLPYFHMTECANGTGLFRGWPSERRGAIERNLIELTKKYSSCGFAVAMRPSDYNEIILPTVPDVGSAYVWLLRHCISAGDKWIRDSGFIGKLDYFFEAGHRHEKQAKRILQTGFLEDKQNAERHKIASFNFRDKHNCVHLQCADLFAWLARNGIMKMHEQRPMRKDLTALIREQDSLQLVQKFELEYVRRAFIHRKMPFDHLGNPVNIWPLRELD